MRRAAICLALVFLMASPAFAVGYFSSVDRFYVHFAKVGRFKGDMTQTSDQMVLSGRETVGRWYTHEARVGRYRFDDRITVGAFAVAMETLSAQTKVPSPATVDRWYTNVITVGRLKVDMTKPVDTFPSLDP